MNMATMNLAFDGKSARSFDSDGRMRVVGCVISVAEVNPYYGREIPGAKALGLDPAAVYDLYRDPEALAAAVPSFDGLPLMIRHVAQTAEEPRKEYIGGSVYNTRFEDGRLLADLLVMDARAIALIQSGELGDLSSSYRYTPDMVAGTAGGRAYHGVMRGIEGNHVALVEDGRATGAHVADSAHVTPTEETQMDEIKEMLAAMAARLEAIEGRANDEAEAAKKAAEDAELEAEKKAAEDSDEAEDEQSEKDREDEREGEERAMDAATVQAKIDAAVKAERERGQALDAAKRATRHVLGDTIAMDSAADVYRAALKQRGINVDSIAAGTEQIAWNAYQAASAGANPHAMDSRPGAGAGSKPKFDTSRINVRA